MVIAPLVVMLTPLTGVLSVYVVELTTQSALVDVAKAFIAEKVLPT